MDKRKGSPSLHFFPFVLHPQPAADFVISFAREGGRQVPPGLLLVYIPLQGEECKTRNK